MSTDASSETAAPAAPTTVSAEAHSKLRAKCDRLLDVFDTIVDAINPDPDAPPMKISYMTKEAVRLIKLGLDKGKAPATAPATAPAQPKAPKPAPAPAPPAKKPKGKELDITTLDLSESRFVQCGRAFGKKCTADFPDHINLMGGEYFVSRKTGYGMRVCGYINKPKYNIIAVRAKLLEESGTVIPYTEFTSWNFEFIIGEVLGSESKDSIRQMRLKTYGVRYGVWPEAITTWFRLRFSASDSKMVKVVDINPRGKKCIHLRSKDQQPGDQRYYSCTPAQLATAKTICDASKPKPKPPQKRTVAAPEPDSPPPAKKQKQEKILVCEHDGNGNEREYWSTREEQDERIRKSQEQAKLPNGGGPPNFKVGERTFFNDAMQHVVVTRVWIDKAAVDRDVKDVFRDQQAIATKYTQMCEAAKAGDGRSKRNVECYDQHSWMEVMWFEHEFMRVILPQGFLQYYEDARHKDMVTNEHPKGLPKPSEWDYLREHGERPPPIEPRPDAKKRTLQDVLASDESDASSPPRDAPVDDGEESDGGIAYDDAGQVVDAGPHYGDPADYPSSDDSD